MSAPRDKAVRKYIAGHAEAEVFAGAELAESGEAYAAIATIPACGEGASLFAALSSIPQCTAGRVAVVVHVNENEAAAEPVRRRNRDALARLDHERGIPLASNVGLQRGDRRDLITIDRTAANALPRGQGVGMARKIAADFAIGLWAAGGLRSRWIHCTDADVWLPGDYFERPDDEAVARVFDFRHEGAEAILEYEIFLRYSVLGLHAADSPWAWHAIGSTLAIDAHAYTQVRGFPRREAAEDFHLLAKLSKLGRIAPSRGRPIRLDDRASERVPFGTGRAMIRARERRERGEPLRVPAPRVYAALACWQRALAALAQHPALGVRPAVDRACAGSGVDPHELLAAAGSLGLVESIEKALSKPRDPKQSLNENFDALATLRLLHALRDGGAPEVALLDALTTAPFLDAEVRAAAPDLEAMREALVRQERRCLR